MRSSRDEKGFQPGFRVNGGFDTPFPCGVKIHASDIGKDVDHERGMSDAEKETGFNKVSGLSPVSGAPNFASAA